MPITPKLYSHTQPAAGVRADDESVHAEVGALDVVR
jgi:hypothetical protein